MKLYAILMSLALCTTAFADWGGILDGAARTQNSTYDNCDIQLDFFINRANKTFEVARIDYSCAMPKGMTLYRFYQDVRMTISNDQLLRNGVAVGTITDTDLHFEVDGTSFSFTTVAGTAAWDTVITDRDSGETLAGRVW